MEPTEAVSLKLTVENKKCDTKSDTKKKKAQTNGDLNPQSPFAHMYSTNKNPIKLMSRVLNQPIRLYKLTFIQSSQYIYTAQMINLKQTREEAKFFPTQH